MVARSDSVSGPGPRSVTSIATYGQRPQRGQHRENTTQEVTFLPMARWRLFGEFENGKSTTGAIVYVRMFTIIALFILVIA